MNEVAENIFREFGELLQNEADVKIKEAMQLFVKASDNVKQAFLHGSGFSGALTAKNLRDHFDYLELVDSIDDVIYNFKENAELEKI